MELGEVSDLVYLSRLEVEVVPDSQIIVQTVSAGRVGSARRRNREVQKWKREKQLGRGGFGAVYLERCVDGSKKGDVRAVKEIRRDPDVDYTRELEAAALFSHSRVRVEKPVGSNDMGADIGSTKSASSDHLAGTSPPAVSS